MATNFSPCKGSYVLNQFPSNVMFGMNGFHVSASGAIQGHHGPLVNLMTGDKEELLVTNNFPFCHCLLQTNTNQGLFEIGLNVVQILLFVFDRVETM